MKYICSADWHVRSSSPAYRKDNYPNTILHKIEFMVEQANRYNAYLLCAGDVFHNTKLEYGTFNRLSSILQQCNQGVLTIPGQHDMEYHKEDDLDESPYKTLIDTGAIYDISNTTFASVYGFPWQADPDSVVLDDNISICMVHICITPGEPPFFLKNSAISAKQAFKIYKNCDYIISGDYHISHKFSNSSRLLLNCGSIGRSNKDQITHRPACFLIDTTRPGKVKRIFIPIQTAEDVFSQAAFVQDEDDTEFSDQIQELADLLKDDKQRPDFVTTTKYLMTKNKAPLKQISIAKKYFRRLKNVG